MGISGISPMSLLIILAIVILLFGTKRIRQMGGDIGGFISGLKGGLGEVGVKDVLKARKIIKKVKS